MTKAEIEDIALGLTFGALAYPVIGLWAIISSLASGFFWWKGGRSGNSWQVYGCSTSTFLPILLITGNLLAIMPYLASGIIMSIGYGIPDESDDGSTLGRFYYDLTKGNLPLTNFLTRGTIYLGLLACHGFVWLLA